MPASRHWTVTAGLVAAVPVVVVNATLNYLALARIVEGEARVRHTLNVRVGIQQAAAGVAGAAGELREYARTGDRAALPRAVAHAYEHKDALDALRVLTADNPEQIRRLDALGPICAECLIGLGAAPPTPADMERHRDGRAERAGLRAAGIFRDMEAAELDLLGRRRAGAAEAVRTAYLTFALNTFLLLGTLAALALAARSDFARRRAAAARLADDRQALEDRVRARTADLEAEVARRRVAEGRLQAVLDAAVGVSIIATDADGLITVFNTGAERMLGWPAAEMIGRQTPAVIHLASEVECRARELTCELGRDVRGFEAFVAVARSGGFESRNWTYVRKDGSTLAVRLVVSAVRDEAGAAVGFLGIAQDVTPLIEAEAALVAARDAALAAARAKSEFLANMSHEIRTPMNGIIGLTDVVLDTTLDAEQRHLLETVRASAGSLLVILNEILDFSKIEAGKLDVRPVPTAVRDLLAAVADTFAPRAAAKGVAFACEIGPEVPAFVRLDPDRLRQIVGNLLDNAVKFTHAGRVAIRAGLDAPPADGVAALRIVVEDTGIGIAADKLSAIFNAFEQADGSTTRLYGGTGLGLSIAARLCGLMGGSLTVRSEPGRGSAFCVRLPVSVADAPARAEPPTPAPVDRPLRFLVADDNGVNRMFARLLVERHGHRAEEAADGRAALAALEAGGFDVVLMDAQMPHLGGVEALRLLRAREARLGLPRVPVVALTADAMSGDRERYLAAGMDGYVSKPIDAAAFWQEVRRVLGPAAPRFDARQRAEWAARRETTRRKLVDLFAAEAPKRIVELRNALDAGDADALARVAHGLRGSCGVFGATRAAELLGRIERRAGPPAALLDEAEREVAGVIAELRRELEQGEP